MQPSVLGTNIRLLRKKARMTQHDLSVEVGVTDNYISLIELGKKIPSLKRLALIADKLGVKPSALLGDDPIVSEMRQVVDKEELGQLIQRLSKLLAEDN